METGQEEIEKVLDEGQTEREFATQRIKVRRR